MGEVSQAALAISLLHADRLYRHRLCGLLDERSLLGLELDDVVCGADPYPPSVKGETSCQRWLRAQKAERDRIAIEQAMREAADKAREAEARARAEARAEAQERWKRDSDAAAVARRVARETRLREEMLQRERLLMDRWAVQAADRSLFESRFSVAFVEDLRRQGLVFDFCTLCRGPFWIQYDSLVNWTIFWKGPPRCTGCHCPPLVDRVRREHPRWTAVRISHAVVTANRGCGSYASAAELLSSRAWWTAHEHDYQPLGSDA